MAKLTMKYKIAIIITILGMEKKEKKNEMKWTKHWLLHCEK
jgi:hypothetical protein